MYKIALVHFSFQNHSSRQIKLTLVHIKFLSVSDEIVQLQKIYQSNQIQSKSAPRAEMQDEAYQIPSPSLSIFALAIYEKRQLSFQLCYLSFVMDFFTSLSI